ncbi:MAG: sialidase family protein [Verrucomicrobiales bacterium]
MRYFSIAAAALLAAPSAFSAPEDCILLSEFIYETAPFPECHASTIEELPGGDLVAAWFGGKHEKNPDVGIWLSRKETGGAWTAPTEVVNGVQSAELRYPCWNPVLFQPERGPLLLFFKVGPSPSEWWGEVIESGNGGKTWANRRKLPDGGIGPVKNKPIQKADGSIWCGSSTEHDGWRLHIEVTGDLGKTWRRIGPLNDKSVGAIQPSLIEHAPGGKMQLLCRNRDGNGKLWQAWSDDGGKTWGALEPTALPNPNAGTDAVLLKDGRVALVYNHTNRAGSFPKGRNMLNLAISEGGREWQAALTLERDQGEYSYPAIIQSRDGMIHITYTWRREKVKHVAIDPAKIELRPIADFK